MLSVLLPLLLLLLLLFVNVDHVRHMEVAAWLLLLLLLLLLWRRRRLPVVLVSSRSVPHLDLRQLPGMQGERAFREMISCQADTLAGEKVGPYRTHFSAPIPLPGSTLFDADSDDAGGSEIERRPLRWGQTSCSAGG